MKNTMRKQMLEKRKKMKKEAVFRKSNAIQYKFLKSGYFRSAKSMLVYMPINNEVLTEKIINKALELGKMVALPVVEGDVLVLSELKSINKVKKGKFSVLEPETRRIISPKKIDTVVMPGIAFDEDGNRVGYGKGYYDYAMESTVSEIGGGGSQSIEAGSEEVILNINITYKLAD